jgi:hypothetical protein
MDSIPDEVIEFFICSGTSSRTIARGTTQPLTEMSTRNLPGVKGSQCVRLTASLPSVSRLSKKCGSLSISQSYVPPWPFKGIALPFTNLSKNLVSLIRYRRCQSEEISTFFICIHVNIKFFIYYEEYSLKQSFLNYVKFTPQLCINCIQ